MHELWPAIARRIAQGLGVQPGDLIQVRGDAGELARLQEIVLAIEVLGATPLIEIWSSDYLRRLWTETPIDHLAQWDRHRARLVTQVDRIVTLQGAARAASDVPAARIDAWEAATQRIEQIEEERRVPILVVASPTERRAQQLGLTYEALEAIVLPALAVSAAQLQGEITRVLAMAAGGRRLTIRTGEGHALHLDQGDRVWLSDDGTIDDADRARGAIVSNLPAGSIYTTVLEDQTHGSLYLAVAGEARDVVLTFEAGRIVDIQAASGAEALGRFLDSHSGEPRRVSHIGIGLNPYLAAPIGWTLVDEHVHGALFLALGENRYMGGQNVSSLNYDYVIPAATLLVGGRAIVEDGTVTPPNM